MIRLTLRSLAAFCCGSAQVSWAGLASRRDRKGNTHACKLKNLGSKILEYCSDVDGGLGADAHLVLCVLLQETLDTTARELECNASAWEATNEGRKRARVDSRLRPNVVQTPRCIDLGCQDEGG